jgi:hypothetical protein
MYFDHREPPDNLLLTVGLELATPSRGCRRGQFAFSLTARLLRPFIDSIFD